MTNHSRRQFLRTAAGLAVGLAAGCTRRAKPGPYTGQELRVFVYAGGHDETMRQVFVPAFENETGASVSLYPGWWDGVPKAQGRAEGRPAVRPDDHRRDAGLPRRARGLFAKLDLANIPNHKAIVPGRWTTGSSRTATASRTPIRR